VDDDALVQRSLAGDRNAFGELVTRYQGPLFNVAKRILRDHEEARDVTQTAFVKAWQHLHQFDRSHRFFSWIYRILMNEALNRSSRRKRHEELDVNLPDPAGTPEDDLARKRMKSRLGEALQELSNESRDVVILRHWLELSYEQIGERLGLPAKTVKSRLFSARRKLAEVMMLRGWETP
jgi:RNA polymerase sigma-70 factor (ECF subfamily)